MYELVGFSNLLNIDCGFVFPVFEKESKLFFQDSQNLIIDNFFEANRERVLDCYHDINSPNQYYSEGTGAVFIFLLSKEPVNYIFGNATEVCNKLSNYLPFVNNEVVKEDINDFILQVKCCRKQKELITYSKNNLMTTSDTFDEILNTLFDKIKWCKDVHYAVFVSSDNKETISKKITYENYICCKQKARSPKKIIVKPVEQ